MTNMSYTEVAKYPHEVTKTTQYNSDNEQKILHHRQPAQITSITDTSNNSCESTTGNIHTSSYARVEVRRIGLAGAQDDGHSSEWKLTVWAACGVDGV